MGFFFFFSYIRSGQNHLARHSERGKKTRQTEEEVGRWHQGMERPGVQQVPEGSGEQENIEKTGCKIICGAPTTLAVKGLLMMMMMTLQSPKRQCTTQKNGGNWLWSHLWCPNDLQGSGIGERGEIYWEKHMHNMICVTLVCIQERKLSCFWSVKCFGLSKTKILGFSQTP